MLLLYSSLMICLYIKLMNSYVCFFLLLLCFNTHETKLSYGYCYQERLFVNISKCYKKNNSTTYIFICTHMDGKCCLGSINIYVISSVKNVTTTTSKNNFLHPIMNVILFDIPTVNRKSTGENGKHEKKKL